MIVQGNNNLKSFGTAIILAGGRSSRMGFDKQFLKIKDRRVMDDLVYKLEEKFEEIIIVTNKPDEYKDTNHKIIEDQIIGKGPLSGIHAGLIKSRSKYAYIIACDMPNINMEYIEYMKEIINNKKIDGCVTRIDNHIEAFNGFYSKNIVKDIEVNLNNNRRSIKGLISKLNFIYIEESQARKFSPNWNMFWNLNTKEDIERYIKVD